MSFSRKRQRFLVDQGYSYKVVVRLPGMEENKKIFYGNRDEQVLLLQQVLAATDADVGEEEMLPGVAGGGGKGFKRQGGNMASMSGADDNVYIESRRKGGEKHPLFKKFRMRK